jgi:cell division protein FtsB
MPTVGHFIAADSVTSGDSCFIHRTLIFTYLVFALFKHCGEILKAQVEQLEALHEADRQRMEALEAQRVAMEQR